MKELTKMWNEYKKNQAEKYLSNDYIASFIRENGLSVQDILDNFTAFDLCYESLSKCENCPGLKLCRQAKKGERVELSNRTPTIAIGRGKCSESNYENRSTLPDTMR